MPDRAADLPAHLRRRVAIDRVQPEVDGGRFAVKRVRGDEVVIEADIVCDGHDELDCRLHIRHGGSGQWGELPLACTGNDRWRASFIADRIGDWQFFITARVDAFATWRRDFLRRLEGADDAEITVELAEGAKIVAAAAHAAPAADAEEIAQLAVRLRGPGWREALDDERLAALVSRYADRRDETRLEPPRPIWVDRARARTSAWYELFPRSWGRVPGVHGTLSDVAERLDYVAGLGFDVVYLPPIHPIGRAFRKGPDNTLAAGPDDVGSPWAIGASEGGHTAIHPQLGGFADFERLRDRAASLGMELALDLALQCAPDHPWVHDHPEWFRHRADGSIRHAENPPKKYQDIVPFDFQCGQWRQLWHAIADVVRFWVEKGVRIFRVDNPHTKPFAFWEWLIAEIHATHPDVLFLSEAFTRPKTMYRLAKLGFTQSYTYFTWRTEKRETGDYLGEVTTPPIADFFRPNFWPNTPDILHESLQRGGQPMFMARLALAALSAGNWGIYGPAMELLEATPREPGSEEYRASEKYEIKTWDLERPDSLAGYIRRLNAIRHAEPALAKARPAVVQPITADHLLAWTRHDPQTGSRVLVVVNLEPAVTRSGRLVLDLAGLGFDAAAGIRAEDLLADEPQTAIWAPDGVEITCTPEEPARAWRLTTVTDHS